MEIYTRNIIAITLSAFIVFFSRPALAECSGGDKICIMKEILNTSKDVKDPSWRDKILRELAKSYTYEGLEDEAIKLISQIEKPDTKAMTIRGIGMAAADDKWDDKVRYDTLFKNLTVEAEKITHAPSKNIAYTYIAMSQAFAKDNTGAVATAKTMTNEALRNKAFGETAEIQADRGDFENAMLSIAEINSVSYRNKAYGTVSEIFTKTGKLDEAYTAANKIDNAYAKAQALQNIVNYGNPEEMLKD